MLTPEILIGLILFAVVSSITPGPNNIMLLASGINFGFRHTIPHMLGIYLGFFSLCLATGLGFEAFLQQFPHVHFILKILSALYLVYLGIHIARSHAFQSESTPNNKPMTFVQAALFQWINPKAGMMAISAMIMFSDTTQPMLSMFWISIIFAVINLPCITIGPFLVYCSGRF